ncbi:MAG: nuclear transport factor 2 family protein [Deltaproteobacteria bacterium]|nr:nuclear transport factor 2 family protein [Deltaproteobacteria bacterium]MBW2386227.1 nuclear transport factor 2 family protein [Deltaproteobacteria bacterium]
MPAFPRDEMEEMVRRWVAANNQAGRTGDWSKMSAFFTEDAIYSWNTSNKWEFVARGRQQIHDWAFDSEMAGLEHWTYPYVRTLIDDQKGEFIGIWRQIAPVKDADGRPYEIAGTGGSWFRYAGAFQWCWQRDFFDHANAGVTFGAMMRADLLQPEMVERMKNGSKQPGWTRRSEFDWYSTIADVEVDVEVDVKVDVD